MHVARLEIPNHYAEDIARIMRPETAEQNPRSYAELQAKAGALILTVKGEDTTSLRAAMNSYLRWLAMADGITEELRKR